MVGKRVLVCGSGSIGRRHIANLLRLGAEVSVWRTRSGLLDEIVKDFPVKVFDNRSEAIAQAEAVVVATATDQHIAIAAEGLKAGRSMFIEKPISHDWIGVEKLCSLAENKIVEVGCQFRAHPNLIVLARKLSGLEEGRPFTYRLAMGQRLDVWRPAQDYKAGYSADSSRGGGALFDLIHQIDIALWFFGPVVGVYAILDKIGDLNIKGDDVTNLLLTHKSGVTGHIQLDMASPVYRCELEVMTSKALFNWSNAQGVLQQRKADGIPLIVDSIPDGFERNDLFLIHMAHFLKRIDNPLIPPLCAFEDGVAALKVALGARKSNSVRKMVTL